jgi:CRISPR-associated endonuclease/helicase Cas3
MRSLFEKKKADLSSALTHGGRHTVCEHLKHVEDILDELFIEYGFVNEHLRKLCQFISLYHDIAKPYVKTKEPHSEPSARLVFENRSYFKNVPPCLFLVGVYLISRHHSNLKKAGHFLDQQQTPISIERCLDNLKTYNVNPLEVADVFGLFKLADSFSAGGFDHKKFLCKLAIEKEKVKKMFTKKCEEERWEEQLKLIDLPPVSMLRAPTGWGKTTASFLFASKKSASRIFLLLPTITAIRDFHAKLVKVYGKKNVRDYFYLYDAEVSEDEEQLRTLFFAKSFLFPIVITTADQFLLTFLQIGKYYTKRVNFRDATLIFDEVHLMSPSMVLLVTVFIQKFVTKYGLRCLFMSATFPKAYRKYLEEELNAHFEDFGNKYEQLRRVVYEFRSKSIESAINDIAEGVKGKDDGNKEIIVAVNTVPRAISLSRKLDELLGKENVVLMHARFTYKDRLNHERDMHSKLCSKKPHVLVATQVCGVSLDVSYDCIYTELAPLGDLIQRFGRVNRYGKVTKAVNAFVFQHERPEPYEEEELANTRAVLEQFNGEKLKNEKQLLDEFDEQFTYEDFLKLAGKPMGMDGKACAKMLSEHYEKENQFFFSADLTENRLRKILEYKDRFSMLALPSPDIVVDTVQKEALESVLEEWKTTSMKNDYNACLRALSRLKKFLIPLPPRYIDYETTIASFPTATKGRYDPRYGFLTEGVSYG